VLSKKGYQAGIVKSGTIESSQAIPIIVRRENPAAGLTMTWMTAANRRQKPCKKDKSQSTDHASQASSSRTSSSSTMGADLA
jgi:hypothetical protein